MKISEIKELPSVLGFGENNNRVDESCFRAFHILEKVKELIDKNSSFDVILEIIEEIESSKCIVHEIEVIEKKNEATVYIVEKYMSSSDGLNIISKAINKIVEKNRQHTLRQDKCNQNISK